eukprot:6182070-Pleurochrysis_carterae.AAC.2
MAGMEKLRLQNDTVVVFTSGKLVRGVCTIWANGALLLRTERRGAKALPLRSKNTPEHVHSDGGALKRERERARERKKESETQACAPTGACVCVRANGRLGLLRRRPRARRDHKRRRHHAQTRRPRVLRYNVPTLHRVHTRAHTCELTCLRHKAASDHA